MDNHFKTERLILNPLSLMDGKFILEILNSSGFIEFIGDREVRNVDHSFDYIRKILSNPAIKYWVVKLKDESASIGIVTLIQRNYLDHPDIGFAFLPGYSKKGYAFEATNEVLENLMISSAYSCIFATTAVHNINSIQLLEKLGLKFDKEIVVEDKHLLLYCTEVVK